MALLLRDRFRAQDEEDYKNENWVVRAREPASFWRENVIAIVILPQGFSKNAVAAKIS